MSVSNSGPVSRSTRSSSRLASNHRRCRAATVRARTIGTAAAAASTATADATNHGRCDRANGSALRSAA
ncbi:hypothetical protein ACQP10_15535 [Streptosporangium sandarakinum]|uniref:hypothetical protein n=1 Tax=Streptosporangium sandarakinum TaxID=1260955 RepID=UPI003D8FA58B